MRKLTVQEMKEINSGGVNYEGCVGNKCCITYYFADGKWGQVCGSIEWYFSEAN